MAARGTVEMGVGAILERGVAWGLPASPLFMAMLMALVFTPSSRPAHEANTLYLVCMAGALVGCMACFFARHLEGRLGLRRAYCIWAGVVLELSWFVLTFGNDRDSMALTAWGTFLVGVSTAVLLVLWLGVDQTASVACEIVKYVVALASAFVMYSLFGIAPGLSWISFLFSPGTCIPLFLRLKARTGTDVGSAAAPSVLPGHLVSPLHHQGAALPMRMRMRLLPALLSSALLVAFGAGLAMLGYGGQQSEYGAGLTALVLALALAPAGRIDVTSLVGQLATPLVVVALCYASLYGTGTPFALLLAGCGAFFVWAITTSRRLDDGSLGRSDTRQTSALLGWMTLCAACGLGVESLLAFVAGVDSRLQAIALVGIIVAVDLAWRTVVMRVGVAAVHGGLAEGDGVPGAAAAGAPGGRAPTFEAANALGEAFGLSAREAQVAAMLCDNRSSRYICVTLDLAPSTVKTHVRHIYEKTGAHSRGDLQLAAARLSRDAKPAGAGAAGER